jgi:hypothetical protein
VRLICFRIAGGIALAGHAVHAYDGCRVPRPPPCNMPKLS